MVEVGGLERVEKFGRKHAAGKLNVRWIGTHAEYSKMKF